MKNRVLLLVAVVAIATLTGISIFYSRSPGPRIPTDEVEVVASGLEVPWSMAFDPDGRLFFTERPGRVNVIVNGKVNVLLRLSSIAAQGEAGLLGLALDPGFSSSRFVYLYYTYRDGSGQLMNRVSRFRESAGRLVEEFMVVDGIPGGSIHDGGRIKFGPDGKLYITAGDAGRSELSQDLGSLAGKILRVYPNGSIPADNPFPGSPVYSLGHRNPQGLAWHPVTGTLYDTEHGPSAHDEINVIEPGMNYGWPVIIGKGNDPRYVDPIYETGSDTWAPSGASFYNGDRFPDWNLGLFIATLRGSHLRLAVLEPGGLAVQSTSAIYQGVYGRLRDVVQGPDGYIYLATNNRDGRGSPRTGDDKILRLRVAPPG